MRIFTAIPLPEEVRDKVGEITRNRLPVSYINPTNLHLTLNFFGEIKEDQLGKIKTLLPDLIKSEKPVEIGFEKLVKFRNQVHLTIRQNPELLGLQKNLEHGFLNLGFKFQERPYYPHVKLTNLHMDKIMHQERKLEHFPNQQLGQLTFLADRIVLYESKLLLHHSKHVVLKEYKFQ
ncbi:MAG: RNA 2',3'-cyclic phosphodiesterase [Candidatus Doudnabacteria bacterium]|nr:RNA 2',3'-cyclic phosphodiesterase [Candidatus Doudnabacteria bacterium]